MSWEKVLQSPSLDGGRLHLFTDQCALWFLDAFCSSGVKNRAFGLVVDEWDVSGTFCSGNSRKWLRFDCVLFRGSCMFMFFFVHQKNFIETNGKPFLF